MPRCTSNLRQSPRMPPPPPPQTGSIAPSFDSPPSCFDDFFSAACPNRFSWFAVKNCSPSRHWFCYYTLCGNSPDSRWKRQCFSSRKALWHARSPFVMFFHSRFNGSILWSGYLNYSVLTLKKLPTVYLMGSPDFPCTRKGAFRVDMYRLIITYVEVGVWRRCGPVPRHFGHSFNYIR